MCSIVSYAADWLAATSWKGHLNSSSDYDKLNEKAQMLVAIIDVYISQKNVTDYDTKVAALAAMVIRRKELKP